MMRMNLQRKYAACAAQIQRYSERIKFVHHKNKENDYVGR